MKLKDKVKHALDESRMLIMGVQVLLGFGFEAFLMRRFEETPRIAHDAMLVSMGLLLLSTLLILGPVARHRIVERGVDTQSLHAFAQRAASLALVPFALSLGIDFFVVMERALSMTAGIAGGIITAAVAVAAWNLVPRMFCRRSDDAAELEPDMETPSLNERIKQVMIEVRVVLPGTQALLGFQFAAVLQDGFEQFTPAQKLAHVIGLAFLVVCVLFLLLPAAFHRIAERGEVSERLQRVAAYSLMAAMLSLALGLAADTFIVVSKSLDSTALGLEAAAIWLVAALGFWIGYPIVKRSAQPDARFLPRRSV